MHGPRHLLSHVHTLHSFAWPAYSHRQIEQSYV